MKMGYEKWTNLMNKFNKLINDLDYGKVNTKKERRVYVKELRKLKDGFDDYIFWFRAQIKMNVNYQPELFKDLQELKKRLREDGVDI